MADASFRELCLDAVDADALSEFWGAVLGRTPVLEEGAAPDVRLRSTGGPDDGLVWINPVPERHAVKNRVHLDLRLPVADPASLVALGARVLREPDDAIGWWVMADPEGNEFCAFGPADGEEPVTRPTPFELNVDAVDALEIARWWADRLGGRVRTTDDRWVWIEAVEGFPYEAWIFDPVPEPKTVKNRMHWDVNLTADDPSAFVAAGARVLAEPSAHTPWWVLADPEGNEFCAMNAEQAQL